MGGRDGARRARPRAKDTAFPPRDKQPPTDVARSLRPSPTIAVRVDLFATLLACLVHDFSKKQTKESFRVFGDREQAYARQSRRRGAVVDPPLAIRRRETIHRSLRRVRPGPYATFRRAPPVARTASARSGCPTRALGADLGNQRRKRYSLICPQPRDVCRQGPHNPRSPSCRSRRWCNGDLSTGRVDDRRAPYFTARMFRGTSMWGRYPRCCPSAPLTIAAIVYLPGVGVVNKGGC